MLLEAALEATEEVELKMTEMGSMSQTAAPARLEGISDGFDLRDPGRFQQSEADGWKEVRVFVRIQMGDGDAGPVELLNLREGFANEILGANPSEESGLRELQQRSAKAPAIGAQERRDCVRGRSRCAVDEDDVAAQAEARCCAGLEDSVFEGGTGRHEGGGGEGSGVGERYDGAVDAGSQAEVVRVEDETRWHEGEGCGCAASV